MQPQNLKWELEEKNEKWRKLGVKLLPIFGLFSDKFCASDRPGRARLRAGQWQERAKLGSRTRGTPGRMGLYRACASHWKGTNQVPSCDTTAGRRGLLLPAVSSTMDPYRVSSHPVRWSPSSSLSFCFTSRSCVAFHRLQGELRQLAVYLLHYDLNIFDVALQ